VPGLSSGSLNCSVINPPHGRAQRAVVSATGLKAELARMEQKLRVWESDVPEAHIPTVSMRLSPAVLRGEVGGALAALAVQQRIDGSAFIEVDAKWILRDPTRRL
jgi:hypothetical protein